MTDQRRLVLMMFRLGAISACVAVLLAIGIAIFVVNDSDDSDGQELVVATTSTSTTTSTTSTTTALAFVEDEGDSTTASFWNLSDIEGLRGSSTTTTTTTTTTIPPTTAAPAPAGPAPVRIPAPSCAAGLGARVSQTGAFTGRSESIHAGLPAVVVKVSNNSSASRRALIGLDQADIVFEERIEASATRFAAVFHSRLPANVGPVRSGRTTDIQILRNLGAPVLGYSGANPGVTRQFADARANGWFTPVVNTDRAPFARDGRYNSPDNLFVDPTSLGACGSGGTPRAVFRYGRASSTSAQPASSVSFQARSPYAFSWDAGSGRWLRSQSGTAHTTREGIRLAADNVIVMFVPYVQSAIDAASVDARTIGTGDAWILRDGTITVGSWTRPAGTDPYTLTDANGTRTNLKPGQTWVVLAPAGSASWR